MTGKPIVDKILVGLALLATLFTTGVFVYTNFIFEKELPDDTQQMLALIESSRNQAFAEAYEMEPMTINLPGQGQRLRYLDIEMHIVPFYASQYEVIDRQQALIRDIVIDIAGHMEPEELNTSVGRILFENRVKRNVNQALDQRTVKEIFYTRFVVQ